MLLCFFNNHFGILYLTFRPIFIIIIMQDVNYLQIKTLLIPSKISNTQESRIYRFKLSEYWSTLYQKMVK